MEFVTDKNGFRNRDDLARADIVFLGDSYTEGMNVNGNETIDAGESNKLVTGENGMSDLIIDAEDDVFFAGANELFAAAIRTFRAPDDPLVGTAMPTDFAVTDSGFLTGVILNSRARCR